jgi:phage virion morphogenesis protein
MTTVTITVNDQAVHSALSGLQLRLSDLGPLLTAVGEEMHQRVDARFASQTGPDGLAWTPNRPATLKAKGGRGGILVDRGHLRRQIVQQVTASTVTLTATMRYAAIHQFGGTIERVAYSKLVRHRTDAKGELLRSKILNGRGLVFASDRHTRARARWFEVPAHAIRLPARPFMPVRPDGSLYAAELAAVTAQIEAQLAAWADDSSAD